MSTTPSLRSSRNRRPACSAESAPKLEFGHEYARRLLGPRRTAGIDGDRAAGMRPPRSAADAIRRLAGRRKIVTARPTTERPQRAAPGVDVEARRRPQRPVRLAMSAAGAQVQAVAGDLEGVSEPSTEPNELPRATGRRPTRPRGVALAQMGPEDRRPDATVVGRAVTLGGGPGAPQAT